MKTFSAALILCIPIWNTCLTAQSNQQTSVSPSAQWSDAVSTNVARGQKVVVLISTKEPEVRHTCHVAAIDDTGLRCSRQLGLGSRRFPANEIEQVLIPGTDPRVWPWVLGVFGLGAGTITGAVFLGSVSVVAAVPVAILGGLIILISPLFGMMADDGGNPDQLVYRKAL